MGLSSVTDLKSLLECNNREISLNTGIQYYRLNINCPDVKDDLTCYSLEMSGE